MDPGSGLIKAAFGGEDGLRSIFSSLVGTPKMFGLMVGVEQQERYVGDEAIAKLENMDFNAPIKRGEVADWEKFETLMHHLFYSEMKVVPEEISILISESPKASKENRSKLSELLFETFNVQKIHVGNSAMLGLYAYGKTTGLLVDSGFNVSSSVPVYEGFPLQHASLRMNYGGEDLSLRLLEMIKENLEDSYKLIKGRKLADSIKEKIGYLALNKDDTFTDEFNYELPDGKILPLKEELYVANEGLFNEEKNPENLSVQKLIENSLIKCDEDIKNEIKENICLTGGTSLLKNFVARLKNEVSNIQEAEGFNVNNCGERQFSTWIGGSIVSSLENFQFMWVSKEEYDESGKNLLAIESKCF